MAGNSQLPFGEYRIRPRTRTSKRLLASREEIKTLVHGDDYVSAGDETSMTWLEQELSKAYEIQTQKQGMGKVCQPEGKVLNRILRCTDVGWEIEADPRHAELVVEHFGIVDKGISTPGVSGSEEEDEEDDVPLVGEDITRYSGVLSLQLHGS